MRKQRIKESRFSALQLKLPSLGFQLGLDFVESFDTRFSAEAYHLLKTGDHHGYLKLSVDPKNYTDARRFADDYAVQQWLTKYPNLDLGLDRKKKALEKFWQAEEVCRLTNERFLNPRLDATYTPFIASVLFTAQRKIQRLLDVFSWDDAEVGFGFGPGATTRLRRIHGDVYYKLQGVPETTGINYVLADIAIRRIPNWKHLLGNRELKHVPGNKVTTVAKNAKTDRTIAIEPDMNMFVQKGIGALIRARLKRVNVDLDDQSTNQALAKEGSISGDLATIDLSSASDSVATNLVWSLLPPDWYTAMNLCRSHKGVLDGTWFKYHKFSSMGNGFTFELESLIFWAISVSVCELLHYSTSKVGIYGDDIVVPTDASGPLIEVLSFCGFTTNKEKTFVDGPFRESCGKHYFQGIDVTPVYLRKDVDSVDKLVTTLNSIRRYSRSRRNFGCDQRFEGVWEYYRSFLSENFSFFIPDRLGDVGLVVNFDEARPSCITRPGRDKRFRYWEGYGCNGYQRSRVVANPQDDFSILSWLYSAERRLELSEIRWGVSLAKEKFRLFRPIVQQWDDLGPWY